VKEFEEETGVSLHDGPYETVGGYVFAARGRLAVVSDGGADRAVARTGFSRRRAMSVLRTLSAI